ncbi:MAG: GNAT family N-acetyltransferase, partial [Erysipelotrichaceae bacterium]
DMDEQHPAIAGYDIAYHGNEANMYEIKETADLFYVGESPETKVAFIDYTIENKILTIWRTEVAVALRGQGIAAKLVDHAVDYARKNKLLINPVCSYAEARFDLIRDYDDVHYPKSKR